tara:strand:- start:1457 stop:1678 length:222 start_codon:yes stop_codon:yes gene_type:complete
MKELIKNILKEETNSLSEQYWEDDDKWNVLERDLRTHLNQIIKKHSSSWGNDQYAVISAIEDIMEEMFSKVRR